MFRQLFWTILILTATILLNSCKKEIPLPKPDYENLIGKWEWVQSTGGWGGGTITPATENYTKTMEFSIKGTYKTYKNGNPETEYKFTFLSTEKTSPDFDKIYYFEIEYNHDIFHKGHKERHPFAFRGQDTLYIDIIDICDGYVSKYIKKKIKQLATTAVCNNAGFCVA